MRVLGYCESCMKVREVRVRTHLAGSAVGLCAACDERPDPSASEGTGQSGPGRVEVLESFTDLELAKKYRNKMAKSLRTKGITDQYGVAVERKIVDRQRVFWVTLRDRNAR